MAIWMELYSMQKKMVGNEYCFSEWEWDVQVVAGLIQDPKL